MTYSGVQQVVIDTETKRTKRWGDCDMAGDGRFDEETETIIENNTQLSEHYIYEWDEVEEKFVLLAWKTIWRFVCETCSKYYSHVDITEPTVCPVCGGVNLSEITEDKPCKTTESPDQTIWDLFCLDSGNLMTTRRV